MYYEEEFYDQEQECLECEEKEKTFKELRECFNGLVNVLYHNHNPKKLEWLLEEMGAQLEMNLPEKPILWKEFAEDQTTQMLNQWKKDSSKYLKSVAMEENTYVSI